MQDCSHTSRIVHKPNCSRALSDEFVDGNGDNSPLGLSQSPSNAIFANHSSVHPNCKVEVQIERNGRPFEAVEPHHKIFLVATEPIDAGAEIRFDYEAGKKDLYWQGNPPQETSKWCDVRLLPPPVSAAERQFSKEAGQLNETLEVPLVALPWHGPSGGDARLQRLVPMLLNRNPANWSLIATHLPGRSGKDCRDRWGQIRS